ncbi:MAG: hypothetical protein BWX70_01963 [Verrucomicrobia bacterium ADurb.Bin070]|nr:MAG: hypothetical protein BWX70_01963 [Verrucomicrobia bacterium ADurb.Bin070]
MAGHVADRPVAVIVPEMPAVRMQVRVIVAEGTGANPGIPVETLRQRQRGRMVAVVQAVAPRRPAMDLMHLADGAGPDVLAQTAAAFVRMAVLPHLGDDAGTLRFIPQQSRIGYRVREGLFDVCVDAAAHGQQCGRRVLMVGRSDHHGVQLFAHRVKQLAVIAKRLNRRNVRRSCRLGDLCQRRFNAAAVRVRERHDPLLAEFRQQLSAAPASAPDQRDAQRLLRSRRALAARPQDRQPADPGRRTFDEFSSLHFPPPFIT